MQHTHFLKVSVLVLAMGSPTWAQMTRRVSVSSSGRQSDGWSDWSTISSDGRFVAFRSFASNLVGGDSNGSSDVFCRGVLDGQTVIASLDSNEASGDAHSGPQSVSADGRYVAFSSTATNLVPGDSNGQSDVFVRDRVTGTTLRVSLSSTGVQGNGLSMSASISADGNHVAFRSSATNLVLGDTNGVDDIFIRDLLSGATERVSVDPNELQSNGSSDYPSVSADGRYVAFSSAATNLTSGTDTNGVWDVFLRDRQSGGFTVRVSYGPVSQGNGHSLFPSITADGLSCAFQSYANNLVNSGIDTNGAPDIFYRYMGNGGCELVSASLNGHSGDGASGGPSISADGKCVAFESLATDLVTGDTNAVQDVFEYSRDLGTTERVSLDSSGVEGNERSSWPAISGDGRFVAFESGASNLVSGDTNGTLDVFLRDRDTTGFTSVCHPGVDGVQPCSCSNPPSLPGRGCDNSSATGGAYLTAGGAAYLSTDSLVFTTFAERPTALSIVLQGTASVPAGVVYGQGIRCAGGSLKRLYAKNASGGSLIAPDVGGGDPAVSARSAAMGDVILPGQSRWYLVFYRDPTVLGGCPSQSAFNTTQTGRVTWMR